MWEIIEFLRMVLEKAQRFVGTRDQIREMENKAQLPDKAEIVIPNNYTTGECSIV